MEVDFPGDVDDPVEVLPRILYLSKLLLEIDFPISADRIVAYTLELWRLSERANSQDVRIGGVLSPMYPGLERSMFSDMFAPPSRYGVDVQRSLLVSITRATTINDFAWL